MTKIILNKTTYESKDFLETVNLNNVEFLSNDASAAFKNCTALTSIENLNKNVTNISNLFESCSNLDEKLFLDNSNIVNASNCFKDVDHNIRLYVPFYNQNGTRTSTYTAFKNAGYDLFVKKDNTIFRDLDNYKKAQFVVKVDGTTRYDYIWKFTLTDADTNIVYYTNYIPDENFEYEIYYKYNTVTGGNQWTEVWWLFAVKLYTDQACTQLAGDFMDVKEAGGYDCFYLYGSTGTQSNWGYPVRSYIDNSIRLPFAPSTTRNYDITINWGDDTTTTITQNEVIENNGNNITHTYPISDEYEIYISSSNNKIPVMSWNNYSTKDENKNKIIKIANPIPTMDTSGSITSMFYECENLEEICENWFDNNIQVASQSQYSFMDMFNGCKKLKRGIIPDGITVTGSRIFQNCSSMTSVYLSNTLTNLTWDVFVGCKSLREIHIPDSVLTIDGNTFNIECMNLEYIYINKPRDSIANAPWNAPNTYVVWSDVTIKYYETLGIDISGLSESSIPIIKAVGDYLYVLIPPSAEGGSAGATKASTMYYLDTTTNKFKPINTALTAAGYSQFLQDITYDNGKYFAVGTSGFMITSTDGLNWTRVTTFPNINAEFVFYKNGKLLAMKHRGYQVYTSLDDGATWKTINMDTSYLAHTSNVWGSGFGYQNGKYYAWISGNSYYITNVIFESTDCLNWSLSYNLKNTFPNSYGFYPMNTLGNKIIAMTGYCEGYIYKTSNSNWTSVTLPTSYYSTGYTSYKANIVINDVWYICHGKNMYKSTDGINWTDTGTKLSNYFISDVYNNKGYANSGSTNTMRAIKVINLNTLP